MSVTSCIASACFMPSVPSHCRARGIYGGIIDAQAGDGVSLAGRFRASYWDEAMGVSEPDGRISGDNSIMIVMRDGCSMSLSPTASSVMLQQARGMAAIAASTSSISPLLSRLLLPHDPPFQPTPFCLPVPPCPDAASALSFIVCATCSSALSV